MDIAFLIEKLKQFGDEHGYDTEVEFATGDGGISCSLPITYIHLDKEILILDCC